MRAGRKSARAESLALVTNRCRGVLLTSTALAAIAAVSAPTLGIGQTLDLNGVNLTLPQPGVFGGAAFINGTDNVTNNGAVNATLTEGGGPAGTTYSGSITDGITNTTALVHTGGTVTILSTNAFTGGTTISGGAVSIGNGATFGTGSLSNSGTLTIEAGGSLTNSSLTNSGTVNAQGTISGPIVNQNAGSFTVTGNLAGNNTFDNNDTATLKVTGGDFTGITTLTNSSTAAVGVNVAAGRTLSAGSVVNNAGATIANDGTLSANTITNNANGTITSTGALTTTAGLTNSGIVNAQGTISGPIVNQNAGSFTVTGNLAGNNKFDNNDTATLKVTGGDFTGITTLTNSSTAAVGVNVAAGRTLSAGSVVNNAGATIANDGTLSANTITNNANGTITSTGALTTTAGLTNSGIVNAQGTISGPIVNQNAGSFTVTGNLAGNNTFDNNDTATLKVTGGDFTGITTLTNSSTAAVGVNVAAGRTLSAGSVVNNAGATIANDGTLSANTITNNANGTITSTGALTTTAGLTNSGIINAQGTISGPVTNAGTLRVTSTLTGSVSTFANESGALLAVGGNSFTGITTLNNNSGGTISLAGGTIGAGTTNNNGLVTATGVSTFAGAFNNQTGGVINLTGGTPTSNQLKTGFFTGSLGSAVNLAFNLSNAVGQSGQLITNGNTGSASVNFTNVGGLVVLGGGPTPVISNSNSAPGSGALGVTNVTGLGSFGLVNVSLQPLGNGNFDLFRSPNTGAIAAPGASIMAALSAVDTSFHQSTSPFVVSPQSQDPDKWSGGIWTRVGGGQVTTKSTAIDGLSGITVPLRVKTHYDAFEVGVDSGLLNFGNSGWNAHFGVMGGTVTATANETLIAPGTQLKFDVPFAGVYGVMTHGPLFMDLSVRHDWADVKVTNFTANLSDTDMKGHSTSVAGAAGYHLDLGNQWFVEPAAGFGLTQTQFDTLQTNVGQTAQNIAPGSITIVSILSKN